MASTVFENKNIIDKSCHRYLQVIEWTLVGIHSISKQKLDWQKLSLIFTSHWMNTRWRPQYFQDKNIIDNSCHRYLQVFEWTLDGAHSIFKTKILLTITVTGIYKPLNEHYMASPVLKQIYYWQLLSLVFKSHCMNTRWCPQSFKTKILVKIAVTNI